MSRSSKIRLQGTQGNCKTSWGSVLTNKGSEPWYQCKGSWKGLLMLTRVSQESHDFQTRPQWRGSSVAPSQEVQWCKVRISEVHGQAGPSCSVVQTRTKAEAWAKFGSQARGGSPQQGFSQLFLPKLAAFAAAWPNATCMCHISQNPRVGEEVAELGGALRALTSRWKWN